MGLYSAVAPLLLLLVSSVWRYPAVLEEVVKWGILQLIANGQQPTVKQGIVVGLVFGLSEAVLFSGNAWATGQWGGMVMRLVLTVPMHTLCAMITAGSMKYKMGILGLGLAMIVHGLFNSFAQ